jgi:predicted membrane channel-forming protein YqfA (hemolysin III family)
MAPTPRRLRHDLRADEAAPWQRLPFITRGYRQGGGGHRSALLSQFRLHNETLNAWTVLLTLAVGTGLLVAKVSSRGAGHVGHQDTWDPSLWALWGGLVPFSLVSIAQHSFVCIDPATATLWRRLDMAFLLALHTAMTFGVAYHTWGPPYPALLAALCGAWALAGARWVFRHVVVSEVPVRRGGVVLCMAATTLCYYLPLYHRGLWVLATRGRAYPELAAALAVTAGHAVGLGCYVGHWPQRLFPGRFDLVVRTPTGS